MIFSLGSDFSVRETVAVNILWMPILGTFKQRPGVMYHESVYVAHGEKRAVPGLAVDRNGVDQLQTLAGSTLGCSIISERIVWLERDGFSHVCGRKSP